MHFERVSSNSSYVEPVTKTEKLIYEIWSDILGIKKIGIKDNFFDLGGHSLLALGLFSRIEKDFGVKIPISTIFINPTIEHLANLLNKSEVKKEWISLAPIRTKGNKRPFYIVPPAASTTVNIADVINSLGADQPIYGLEPLGLENDLKPHNNIEEMAAFYISEIKTLQPEGPYMIGGACFGVLVAYEMASQLMKKGDEVSILILIDYDPGRKNHSRFYYISRFFKYLKDGILLKQINHEVKTRGKNILHKLRIVKNRTINVLNAHNKAYFNYKIPEYEGKVVLFQSSMYNHNSDILRRWKELIKGELDNYHYSEAHHEELFNGGDLTKRMGNEIQKYLDRFNSI